MLQKLLPHFLLALVFFALTLVQQYSFFAFAGLTIVPLTAGKYFGVFLFLFAASFIKGHRWRFAFLSLVMVLNFFQMCHLSYFGTQILPVELYLFFTQFHEITGSLKEDFRHVLIPAVFAFVPIFLAWKAHKKIAPTYKWRAMGVLFCLYFIYNPVRTFVTGNTWGRQPSTRELTGMNFYLTWSYFMGRILPYKISQASGAAQANSSAKLNVTRDKDSGWDKVILVQGESLTPNHLELFGYTRPTTPFLNTLKGRPHFFFTRGLSGGVSTDISVAFFMNLGFGSSGSLKAAKGDHCLIRLAKQQGFSTYFISVQSEQQLRYITPYICSAFLDDFRPLEEVAPQTVDEQAAIDRNLLPVLKTILFPGKKQFIVLHQRGSHGPWNLRYTQEAKKFEGKTMEEQRVAHYDNSVLEFDLFWKELDAYLKTSKEKVLVLYTSDHGEAVGEKNRWGHGFVEPLAFEVPVLALSYNQDLPSTVKALPKFATHYNLGLLLARELGYKTDQPPAELPKDYVIYGNDIDGFAGKATVEFDEKGYTFNYSP